MIHFSEGLDFLAANAVLAFHLGSRFQDLGPGFDVFQFVPLMVQGGLEGGQGSKPGIQLTELYHLAVKDFLVEKPQGCTVFAFVGVAGLESVANPLEGCPV